MSEQMPRYLVSRSGLRAYASSLITDEIVVVLLPDALAAVAAARADQQIVSNALGFKLGRATGRADVMTASYAEAVAQGQRDALALEPAENMALTVAWAQLSRGEQPMDNVAAACVIALHRITSAIRGGVER